jgi:hypothetical protein
MKKLVSIITALIFFGVANTVFAQGGIVHGAARVGAVSTGDDTNEASHHVGITVPTVALVDVEGADGEAGTINLVPDISGLEAGESVDFSTATDNSLWLNYTSIVGGGEEPNTRNISAKISEGSLPGGIDLQLTVGGISTGNGTKGQSAANNKVLSTSAQDVVTGIGTCYTESGNNNGHQLTYTLNMDNGNYQALTAGSFEVTVQYTISEDN